MLQMKLWLPLTLLVVGVALGVLVFQHPTLEVTIAEAELQEKIDARLLVTGERMGLEYQVTAATVELLQSGRIGISSDVAAHSFGSGLEFDVDGSGELRYEDGHFYLRDFTLERLTPRGGDGESRLGSALSRIGLTSEKLVQATEEVADRLIRTVLERRPVYSLKTAETSGYLLSLSLRDIQVADGEVVVTLDPLSAAARLLSTFVTIVLVLGAIFIFVRYGGLRLLTEIIRE